MALINPPLDVSPRATRAIIGVIARFPSRFLNNLWSESTCTAVMQAVCPLCSSQLGPDRAAYAIDCSRTRGAPKYSRASCALWLRHRN
jgi:hypothetical protein